MPGPRLSWAPFVALAALAGPAPAAPLPGKVVPPASYALPFGVADDRTGFFKNDKGGIDAVDLRSGKALWTAKVAGTPLAVAGPRLVAQVGKKVVVLDTGTGKPIRESAALGFPDWVAVGTAYGRSYAARGWVDGDKFYLAWEARAWYAGGARPTPEVERRARKHAAGVARIDLATGKVDMLEREKAPRPPGPKVHPAVAKAAARSVWTAGGQESVVRTAGKYAVAADLEAKGPQQSVVLRRWELDGGKELAPVTLLTNRSLRVEWGADNKVVLVHPALVREALPAGDYAWWAFSAQTGKQVGKFEYAEGTAQATALGPHAYYVVQGRMIGRPPFGPNRTVPRTLRAVDLKSGKLAWERSVEGQVFLLPRP